MAIGERHGLFLVLALAVSAKEAMRFVVQASFQRYSRCELLVRPVRSALQRSESRGEEVFPVLFRVGQDLTEVCWDCFLD